MRRILLAVILLATACASQAPATVETPAIPVSTSTALPVETAATAASPTPAPLPPEAARQPAFARYDLQPVAVRPSLPQEQVDQGFGNVLVPLVLSAQQLDRLAADGVVASPGTYPEFHDLYGETLNANLPVFVTSDALLHAYHLIFDQLLRSLEEAVFLPHLQELNRALLAETAEQYNQLEGTGWEDAARRVYAYVAVGTKLADPAFELPGVVKDLAEGELAAIHAASGPAPSLIFPLLKHGEDYSQYVPRGHYNQSEHLQAYFRAMTWYGRMTFRLSDPDDPQVGPDETRMALLLSLAVRDGRTGERSALDLWQGLYEPTAFLVGRSDDLTIAHYLPVIDRVFGPQLNVKSLADDALLPVFFAEAEALPPPRILGLLSEDYKPVEATKGLRLLGQRFVLDAYVFQKLIHPQVPDRFLPSGLDVMAAMGSERARVWRAQDLTTLSPRDAQQMAELANWLEGLDQDEWVETAYNSWLYTLHPLLDTPEAGYPIFMQSTAWQDKQLNTALGSWAELKHDTLLYAKQPYGGIGGCGWPTPPDPVEALGYVEPVPEVFSRIAALAHMTRRGLEERDLLQLLPQSDEYEVTLAERLVSLAAKSLEFKVMAEKELQGQPLSQEEQGSIRGFEAYLEELVIWANGEKPELDPAAVIADVATDPNSGNVLEVGIGNVHEIYVVAPIPHEDGSLALTVARGGIFSYYEFPSSERLSDEVWRTQVKSGQTPAQPAFTGSFSVSERAPLDMQAVIYRFQRDWANWLYLTSGYTGTQGCQMQPSFLVPVSNAVLEKATLATDSLVDRKQYEGRQLVQNDYLSIEQVVNSPDRVIVTVRETWKDYLVTYEDDDPFAWFDAGTQEPILARRGPYTVDIAYTLAARPVPCQNTIPYYCYQWTVLDFTELTERPAWK